MKQKCQHLRKCIQENKSKLFRRNYLLIIAAIVLLIASRATYKYLQFKLTDALVEGFVFNQDPVLRAYARRIFVVNNVHVGGASKFLDDLIESFPDVLFIPISNKKGLLSADIQTNEVLFVNHLIHTDIKPADLVEMKSKTGVKLVTQLHDFYLFTPQSLGRRGISMHTSYLFKNKLDAEVESFLFSCTHIISPSMFVQQRFERAYSGENIVTVYPNDYSVSRDKVLYPTIKNREVNIGMFATFTDVKGSKFVEILRARYPAYLNYTINFKVIGVNLPKYNDTADSFNSLVEAAHIHGLVYLSRFAETYCYAMTKYLNTKLPILYNRIGALKERLGNEMGTYKVFEHESDISNALFASLQSQAMYKPATPDISLPILFEKFESFVRDIIDNSEDKKYDFSEPKFEVRPFYKRLLRDYMTKDHLVIITSKLQVSDQPFSYVGHRTIYSQDERFAQTRNTIESVRKYIPNAFIVLVDNTENLPYETTMWLTKNTDVYVASSPRLLRYFTDEQKFKAFAELAQMIHVYNSVLRHMDVSGFKNVFKLTGRYTVDQSFDISQYNKFPDMNIFARDEKLTSLLYYYTCFYKIAPNQLHSYFAILKKILLEREHYIMNDLLNLEEIIPLALNFSFVKSSHLGIRQNVAVQTDTSII